MKDQSTVFQADFPLPPGCFDQLCKLGCGAVSVVAVAVEEHCVWCITIHVNCLGEVLICPLYIYIDLSYKLKKHTCIRLDTNILVFMWVDFSSTVLYLNHRI